MITLSQSAIAQAEAKGMDSFLTLFTDAFLHEINGELSAQNMSLLNGYQHALLALRFFSEEVNEGGFVQLIQNGYGGYLFLNPTAKAWKLMGAKQLSKILYKAKTIYDKHRQALERETTDDEFMAMYEQFEQFDVLEEKYMEVEEQEMSIIATYVKEHIDDFAQIV